MPVSRALGKIAGLCDISIRKDWLQCRQGGASTRERVTGMRYEKGHKELTRQRIVEAASERFRSDGIDAVGVVSLMGDVGLTQGGFYNHFPSKEDLVRECVATGVASAT